jgi:signal transduction histidine kinase
VWHVRLYSIHHKILAFFALLILGVLLLGGVAITLAHRMHTSTVAVRDETQDIRWNDELRIIFLDFFVVQYRDLSVAEREAAFVRLQQDFLSKLDTYIQSEQARGASTSREELAILFQIRDNATQTMELLAQAFSPAYEHDAESHAAIWRQLHEKMAVIDTGFTQVAAINQRLIEDALRHAEQGPQRLSILGFVLLHLGIFSLLGGHLLLYKIVIDPLRRLNIAIRRVAQGSFTERVVIEGTGEFSELALSFNTMAAQLEADTSLRRVFYKELETQVAERTKALQTANQELQQTQIRLLEAERTATICEMAVSVTHEIRQPLNALSINFQMIKRGLRRVLPTLDAKVAEHIQLLDNEIQRINDVSTSFMKSVQVARSQRHPMDLAKTMRHVVQLLEYEATAVQVTLHYQDDANLPLIVADENQIRQVLINLLLNAIQAQLNGGTVSVSTRYDADIAQIRLLVQDNGPGIAPELLEKIWRPFFTTKAAGIGLGLAIVRRIILEHGGDIACTSTAGQGTCFHIVLPVTDTSASRATPAEGGEDAHQGVSSR